MLAGLFFTGQEVTAAERLTLNFNPGWKFIKADPAGAQQPDFNDAGWTTISTPHTFNDVDTFDNRSPGRMLGETNQWSGRTWYRKTFALPESARGKKIYIEFEAVRQVAEVYLNGHFLGTCKNGFIPFGFDLTPYIQFGKPNVLAVMCDNSFMISQIANSRARRDAAGTNDLPAPTLSAYEKRVNASLPDGVDKIQADQIPWNDPQWHPPLGGIYRDVKLFVVDPLHISLPLFDFLKTAGPYVYATEISNRSANIGVEMPVENGRASDEKIEVTAQILDRDGKAVLTLKQNGVVAAGAQKQFTFSGAIENPQLWEPDYPYLYHVVCSVQADGKPVDSTEIPLGIRAVHWDIKTGFWINGRHLKLHGWGQRPTDEWPGLGTAQPDWLHFFTLQLMKNAGGNFIRWGHCAGGPEMIQAGDRLGLIADQPGVDGEADTVGAAWEIRAAAFRDAIIYFRNDPSILIWEGGNQKVTRAHAEEMRGFVNEFDPRGGRTLVFRRADETTGQFMDITLGTEGSHEIPRLPVVEGEYDREESPRRVWDDFSPPEFGYPEAKGQTYDLTSEQFAVNEVSQYVNKIGAASDCGGANWIFSDSTSGGRNTAEVDRASGEVDGVRLPKQAYYVCQTIFRNDPQVHIIGHWNYPAGTKKTIYVTSNCDSVELFVNGKPLGHGEKSDRYLFTFPDIAFAPGEIKAVASNNGIAVATNEIRTAGAPVALRLTPILGPGGLLANGSDVALIDVEAIDVNGERCPTFQKRVNFKCAGPAIWRGGYDSGKANSINKLFLDLECGINRVAVRSTLAPGEVSVTANCPGLKSASLAIQSHPFAVENNYSRIMPAMPTVALSKTHPDWSDLANATPPMTVTAASENAAPMIGRFTEAFSYTGPTELVHVEANAADGKNIYCDRDYSFAHLPKKLAGADWVQAADADSFYSATDLMQLGVKADSIVYVAHDARLPNPDWLQRQFRPTTMSVTVRGNLMKIFERRVRADASLTLGSNTTDPQPEAGNMYVVFVKGTESTAPYQVSR
ncbi:MAG: sugar-binding domain-containing protein [Limisphaerales bacterium]